ncbi:peptidase domain-containing ABC transporter [Ktedonobacter sp. SOSP1-52]|uniref:peptidase domain-containing ABC transporter n=1 Tax=Ktedonobacter sp. SOSP1-52 TaxID=2778366 RepID=UPI001F2F78CF|nr:peptidase domain-containing ABC transporter [Ktedonobacter sp. SOSP1-52]
MEEHIPKGYDTARAIYDAHQTSKRQKAVQPRLSLPSHEQRESGCLPCEPVSPTPTSAETPTHPMRALKELVAESARPVAALQTMVLDPSRFFSTREMQTPSGPRLLALPSHHRSTGVSRSVSLSPQTAKHSTTHPAILSLPSRQKEAVPSRNRQRVDVASSSQGRPVTSVRSSQERQQPPQATEKARTQEPARPRRLKHLRRVPAMRQMTAVECGAACLAMILTYYGCATRVSDVQERCGVGRDGLSARAIAKSARQYGCKVRAVSLKVEDFRFVSLPAIIHWEFNHFVVVERWSKRYVDLVDPAVGRRRITHTEFEEGFTGVVLMVEPGPQFTRQSSQRSFSLGTYARSMLSLRGILIQIIGASLLLQLLGLCAPLLTAVAVDTIIPSANRDLLMLLGVGMLLLIFAQGVTKLLRATLIIYLQTRIDVHMTQHFFTHLLSLPYRFFQLRLSGDLLSRMSSNAAIRDLLSSQLVSTVLDSSSVLLSLIALIWLSKLIAGVTVLIGAFQIGLLLLTAPSVRRLMQRELMAQGKAQGYLNETLAGIATLKAAGAEERAFDRWTNLYFEQMNISIRRNYLVSLIGVIFELLYNLSPTLLLWIGTLQVINGAIPLGTMFALTTLATLFLMPLSSLASSGQKLQIAGAHFERIADVLEAEPEQDPLQVRTPPTLTGRIEVNNVRFQYAPHTPLILNDITVNIAPGQRVALVGRTGSGKSTLGKLLIGLLTPTQGTIAFDGIPLQELNYREVRSQFGVVLQESFIFSGSVRENIALNHPEMDMAQVMRAAQLAAIHEDIEKMPMGYETVMSEGGSSFSGGQRQRLALARALAHQPAVLLLDEATSALDVTTERAVEQNLSRFSCTQVVIAHRLSTIRNADLILVLDQGRIVEQGSHERLLRRGGYYAQLIQSQIESGEIEAA